MKKREIFVLILLYHLIVVFIITNGIEIKQINWKGIPSDYLAGQLIVGLKPNTDKSLFDPLIQNIQGTKTDSIPGSNVYLISFHQDSSILNIINTFTNNSIVEFAEPNMAYYPVAEQYQDSLWGFHNFGQSVKGVVGVSDVDADIVEAWNIETGDTSVFISVIDRGIAMDLQGNLTHPDLNDESRIRLDTAFTGSRLSLRDST